MISESHGVSRYVAYSEDSSGTMGTLFVTSFRVAFITIKLDQARLDPRVGLFTFSLIAILIPDHIFIL